MAIAMFSGCAEKEKTVKQIVCDIGTEYVCDKDNVVLGLPNVKFEKWYSKENSNGVEPCDVVKDKALRALLKLEEQLGQRAIPTGKDKWKRKQYSWHKDGYIVNLSYHDESWSGDSYSISLEVYKY